MLQGRRRHRRLVRRRRPFPPLRAPPERCGRRSSTFDSGPRPDLARGVDLVRNAGSGVPLRANGQWGSAGWSYPARSLDLTCATSAVAGGLARGPGARGGAVHRNWRLDGDWVARAGRCTRLSEHAACHPECVDGSSAPEPGRPTRPRQHARSVSCRYPPSGAHCSPCAGPGGSCRGGPGEGCLAWMRSATLGHHGGSPGIPARIFSTSAARMDRSRVGRLERSQVKPSAGTRQARRCRVEDGDQPVAVSAWVDID